MHNERSPCKHLSMLHIFSFFMTPYNNYFPDTEQTHAASELERKLRGREIAHKFLQPEEVYAMFVRSSPDLIHTMPDRLRQSKAIMLSAVKARGNDYRFTDSLLRSDAELLLVAMSNGFPAAFGLAHESLRDNEAIVSIALDLHPGNVIYVSRRLRADREIMRPVIEANPLLLEYVSMDIRDREDIIQPAVQMNGMALEFVSERLRNDTAIVTLAIESTGCALRFACRRLRFNPALVAKAVEQVQTTDMPIAEVLRYTSRTIRKTYGLELC
jgi:hypothetical protein